MGGVSGGGYRFGIESECRGGLMEIWSVLGSIVGLELLVDVGLVVLGLVLKGGEGGGLGFMIDDPNITMEEYIKLQAEKAQRRGRMFNWETATYGKSYCDDLDFSQILKQITQLSSTMMH
ncbi:hypothetical protein Tco_0214171 [Tanacetum coccineum]